MTNQLPSYSSVQTMDVIESLLNPRSPFGLLLDTVNTYAEFVEAVSKSGHLRTPLGFSWDDPSVDVNEVEAELFPNALAFRMGW